MRPDRKQDYREGDWFLVPLTPEVSALGVIARMGRCPAIFGYFFAPPEGDPLEVAEGLTVESAILLEIFGYLRISDGYWPIIGRTRSWDRTKWPMPRFWQAGLGGPWGAVVEYPDENPCGEPTVTRCLAAEVGPLPPDRAAGAGAVEIGLRKLLGLPQPPKVEGVIWPPPVLQVPVERRLPPEPAKRRRSPKKPAVAPAPGGPEGGRPGEE